jgi:hypothetical protein
MGDCCLPPFHVMLEDLNPPPDGSNTRSSATLPPSWTRLVLTAPNLDTRYKSDHQKLRQTKHELRSQSHLKNFSQTVHLISDQTSNWSINPRDFIFVPKLEIRKSQHTINLEQNLPGNLFWVMSRRSRLPLVE